MNDLLCGSISSITLAIGMKFGRNNPEDNPQLVWNMVDEYVAELIDKFGAVNCRQLTGLNMKKKEDLKEYFAKVHDYTCADRIRFAVGKGIRIFK